METMLAKRLMACSGWSSYFAGLATASADTTDVRTGSIPGLRPFRQGAANRGSFTSPGSVTGSECEPEFPPRRKAWRDSRPPPWPARRVGR